MHLKIKQDVAGSVAQGSAPTVKYPFKCPYCGDSSAGALPAGRYCCSECRRTVVFFRTPTAEEVAILKQEGEDVNRLFEPSFNLAHIREAVNEAFTTRPQRDAYIKFDDTHAMLICGLENENRPVVSYPKLATAAGVQALTHQCMIYVRDQAPDSAGKTYFEGNGFFCCKYDPR